MKQVGIDIERTGATSREIAARFDLTDAKHALRSPLA